MRNPASSKQKILHGGANETFRCEVNLYPHEPAGFCSADKQCGSGGAGQYAVDSFRAARAALLGAGCEFIYLDLS
jgi:hypothetical protein